MNSPTIMFPETTKIKPAPRHTKEDLARFLNTIPYEPERHTVAEYAALGTHARTAYDRQRKTFLSGGITIHTPDFLKALVSLAESMNENIHPDRDPSGLILTGDATLGKTTATRMLIRYVHDSYVRQFPDYANHGRVPIVFIEVPATCTGRALMCTFAHFFGMTVARTDTMEMLRQRVVAMMDRVGTRLVVVDELHNLSAANKGNGESVDILRSLHRDVFATFLYAGIDLDTGDLLSGPRGRQIAARFTMMPMERYHPSSEADHEIWRGIIEQFEDALPLLNHKAGSLVALSAYLLERTNGSIGSLGRLINGAANGAVGTTEAVTRALLDKKTIDFAAETARIETLARKTRSRQSAGRITGGTK